MPEFELYIFAKNKKNNIEDTKKKKKKNQGLKVTIGNYELYTQYMKKHGTKVHMPLFILFFLKHHNKCCNLFGV